MSAVFRKLNLKDQDEILVLNAPSWFEAELNSLKGVSIVREVDKAKDILFSLAFVTKQDELNQLALKIVEKSRGDAVVWFAYPKGNSKKSKCEFHRDCGWAVLGAAGFEGVRQVAIDGDWSALRFRRVEFIKSMKRDPKRALSAGGKQRTSSR